MDVSIKWIALMSLWLVCMLVWAYLGPIRKDWVAALPWPFIAMVLAAAAIFVG